MKLRKLYDKPEYDGLYFCLNVDGDLKIAKLCKSKWYAQYGDGREKPEELLGHEIEQRVMWIDQDEGTLIDPQEERRYKHALGVGKDLL